MNHYNEIETNLYIDYSKPTYYLNCYKTPHAYMLPEYLDLHVLLLCPTLPHKTHFLPTWPSEHVLTMFSFLLHLPQFFAKPI